MRQRNAGLRHVAMFALTAALALMVTEPVSADEGPDPAAQAGEPIRPFTITAIWENDGAYVRPGGPDRHYTNGLLISFAYQPGWADEIARWLSLDSPQTSTAGGFVAGHHIYTPENLLINPPDPTDRPYAGYLFGGVFWQREHDDALDHVQIDLGVVGPSAGAKGLQVWIHDTFSGDDPMGWDSQLADEFAFQAYYRKKWRYDVECEWAASRGLTMQLIPQAGVALGTVFRHADAGVLVRVGQNIPDDFGPGRVADVASATALSRPLPAEDWGWYVFFRGTARVVQHNIFIDGSEFNTGPGVNSEPLVGEFQAGVNVRYRIEDARSIELGFAQTILTREFEGQDAIDGYGTLLLTYRTAWGAPPE